MPSGILRRTAAVALLTGGVVAFAFEAAVLADLFRFEIAPLTTLVGLRGLLLAAVLNAGLLALMFRVARRTQSVPPRLRRATNLLIGVSVLLSLWVLEWMFMEAPLTTRVLLLGYPDAPPHLAPSEREDFEKFSLVRRAPGDESRQGLSAMYARTRLVNPAAYDRAPLGATIDKYATQHGVDPSFIFFRAYLNSYYGEATSGRVPFLGTMTAETIRDLVQIHLPGWFIESTLRTYLISSPMLETIFGRGLGWKLRYALHKANLDVSTQPYDLNTYSDTFVVLHEYPAHFPDVLSASSSEPLDRALRDSFLRIRSVALRQPFESPYSQPPMTREEYDTYRTDMKRFARAAYYKTALDFDFATRVQALLAARDRDIYARELTDSTWTSLPGWQQNAMLNMVRDVFEPHVGRVGYNLYALPELNRSPINFVVQEAMNAGEKLGPDMDRLWRPGRYDELWGAAGYQLTVLSEVLSLATGSPIPGIHTASTIEDASKVIWLDSRLRTR